MHAVASLLSGIRGAEGGYARLYQRGTTTRATWYETFEGDNADSSGDDIALDENGGAEVYVNQLVDVVVLDSDGAEVRRFTDGYSAPSIEVRSQSLTGTDYDDASTGQGSNYPLTLAQALDRWLDSAGTYDWEVVIGGVRTTLQNAAGRLNRLIYNVRSSEYGAVGNGVADDQVAIDAAIAAASAAGGGIVFFPAGTYRHTSAIIVPASVSLLGCGSSASIITTDHASQNGVTFNSAGSYAPQTVRGLRVGAAQTNTGIRCVVSTGAKVKIEDCYFGGTNTDGYALSVSGNGSEAHVYDSMMSTPSANKNLVTATSGAGARSSFTRCKFVATAAAYTPASGMLIGVAMDVAGCVFDASACTAGTIGYYVSTSTTLDATFDGCRFLNGGGATVTALTLGIFAASSFFVERNSVFGSSVTAYSYTSLDGVANQSSADVRLLSRETRTYYATQGASPFSIGTVVKQYGRIVINDTLGNMTVSFANDRPPHGAKTRIAIWNTSGGAAAITFNDPLSGDVAADAAIADDDAFVYDYIFHVFSATTYGYSGVAFDAGFGF